MSAIPYTVERRPDTGLNNVTLGMWLFLASEAMLFAGLFSSYFTLRAGAAAAWAPLTTHLGAAAAGTFVLIAASIAFTGGVRASRRKAAPGADGAMPFRGWLLASLLFAIAFCALKLHDYSLLFAEHLGPATSTQLATYFLLTGIHLLHVAGGIVVTAWLLARWRGMWRSSPAAVVNRLEAAALYWYFVDLVWIIIFVLLYVV